MAKSYVLWGCGGHAKVLASLIDAQGGNVLALFDNRPLISVLPGVPLYCAQAGFSAWLGQVKEPADVIGSVAIGGHKGRDRLHIQNIFRAAGLRLESLVHPSAQVCHTALLGAGTQVLALAIVAADARIGAACIVNHKASVDHECVIGDGVHLAPGATVCGCVTIGDNVLVGAGAVILPRLNIGANSIIGAGAVVTRDVAPDSVVAGNPAKKINP